MKIQFKRVLAVLVVLLLAACGSPREIREARMLLYSYITGNNQKVPRETAAAIPYATMGLEFGFGPQVLLVLGAANLGVLDWYAGGQLYVSTQRGRVVRTVGLPFDLGGSGRVQAATAGAQASEQSVFALDFPDLGIYGAVAQCTSEIQGDEAVEIFGASMPTRHVVEHCSVPEMRWDFENDYWEDLTTGYVWRSRQHVHPDMDPVELEVFRPEEVG